MEEIVKNRLILHSIEVTIILSSEMCTLYTTNALAMYTIFFVVLKTL